MIDMYGNIAARVPETILKDIDYVAKEENTDKSKVIREMLSNAVKEKLMELALEKYSKRKVSLGRAAELAKMPLADFMVKAAERKITINYSVESLERDLKSALKAK
ncbi:UPF0175 family protein [Candidatus Woesearchaeota archaeon]|nr:UPF0175 family protein [Candidatus Woesearchaeota archaeon]